MVSATIWYGLTKDTVGRPKPVSGTNRSTQMPSTAMLWAHGWTGDKLSRFFGCAASLD